MYTCSRIFLIHVDLPEWFEDLTDDNVSAFKDVSTFKLLRLTELIPMKFIELSYKDSILHHFHHKEKIKYWFLLIIIIINILLFYRYSLKSNWSVWKKKPMSFICVYWFKFKLSLFSQTILKMVYEVQNSIQCNK